MKELFKKALEINSINPTTSNELLSIEGTITSYEDLKFLLDNYSDISEIDKQCIVNTVYNLQKLN